MNVRHLFARILTGAADNAAIIPQCGPVSEKFLLTYVWVPLGVQCLIVAFLLFLASKKISNNNHKRLFPMYFWALVLLCPFWIVRAILLLVLPMNRVWSTGVDVVLIAPLVAGVREGVAFFLVQTGAGRHSLRRTVMFTAAWIVTLAILGICALSEETMPKTDAKIFELSYIYWFINDGLKAALYIILLIVWFRPSNDRGRRSGNWIYPAVMCLLYISFVVGDVLAYYKVTACVNLITDIVYYWCWPLLTFFVLRCDSNYWRNVGRPLNCDAASRAVVRRLAGARNGEFAALLDDDALSMNEQRHSSDDNVLTDAHIIDFARLKILRRLGERTSRMELLAAFLDGEPVCVRRYAVAELSRSTLDACVREITIAACLPRHPNIALLYGVSVMVPALAVVCEFAAHGTLRDFITRRYRVHAMRSLSSGAPVGGNTHSECDSRKSTDEHDGSSHGSLPPSISAHGSCDYRGTPPPLTISPPPPTTTTTTTTTTRLTPRRERADTSHMMFDSRQFDSMPIDSSTPPPARKNTPPVTPPPRQKSPASRNGSLSQLGASAEFHSDADSDFALGMSVVYDGRGRRHSNHSVAMENISNDPLNFMPTEMKLSFARDLTNAVAFLHAQSPPIAHSDISAKNCLICNDGNSTNSMVVKLTDFGTESRLIKNNGGSRWASRRSAPDMVDGGRLAADVCATGVVLHEIMTGRVPSTVEIAVLQREPGHRSQKVLGTSSNSSSGGVADEAGAHSQRASQRREVERSRRSAAMRRSKSASTLVSAMPSTTPKNSINDNTMSEAALPTHDASSTQQRITPVARAAALMAATAGIAAMPLAWRNLLRHCWASSQRSDAAEIAELVEELRVVGSSILPVVNESTTNTQSSVNKNQN